MNFKKKWSKHVTKYSDALDLEKGIFTEPDPKKIAQSVKRSADKSIRKKTNSKRSALAMLSFYVNRAGKNLSAKQKEKIQKAKEELRKLPSNN